MYETHRLPFSDCKSCLLAMTGIASLKLEIAALHFIPLAMTVRTRYAQNDRKCYLSTGVWLPLSFGEGLGRGLYGIENPPI